jgi:hypothetical protein
MERCPAISAKNFCRGWPIELQYKRKAIFETSPMKLDFTDVVRCQPNSVHAHRIALHGQEGVARHNTGFSSNTIRCD